MENIATILVGLVCIFIGIANRKGNISMLHAYHRKRVAEEDKLPFGKLVGLGMFFVGISLIGMGGLYFAAEQLEQRIYFILGTVLVIVGMAAGLAIFFYALKKYNKGIF